MTDTINFLSPELIEREPALRLSSERVTRESAAFGAVMALYETAFPADERAPLDMLVDGKDWNGDFRAYFVQEQSTALENLQEQSTALENLQEQLPALENFQGESTDSIQENPGEKENSLSGQETSTVQEKRTFCGLAFNYVDDRFCYLFYLAVEPQMRKRGIGSAILRDIQENYPDHSLILEMEELDPAAENYAERLSRAQFYQGNGLKLTGVHNTQCGVPYHVLCTDPTISLADYSRMWHNIVRIQGYSEIDGQKWLDYIFGDSINV